MFFKKQENKDELQRGHINHIEHGGVAVKDVENMPRPNPFAEPSEPHIINRSQLVESKINLEQYGKVVEYVNLLLKTFEKGNSGLTFGLNGEHALNAFEADKLAREINRAGYICHIDFYCEPFTVHIQF